MACSDLENDEEKVVTNLSMNGKDDAKIQRHWDSGDRVAYAAHIFWMIKEIGWVLLIPELCLPCGALAGIMMTYSVVVHCCRRNIADVLCELVMCVWLCSNVIWMTSEVLFDDPDAEFPWDLCPVVPGDHQKVYDAMSLVFRNGFLLGVAIYLLGVAGLFCVHRRVRGPVGEALLQCYLCSWCLKDFFWADENVWPAMSTDLVTVPMLLYHIHLQSGIRTASNASMAWIAWALANGVWILGELEFPGLIGFNIAAACLLFVALLLLLCGYASYKAAEQLEICHESEPSESSSSE